MLPLLALVGFVAVVASGRRAVVGASTSATYPMEDSEETRAILELRANAIAAGNAIWIQSHPDAPCCAECAGVRYTTPPVCGSDRACQLTLDAAELLRRGKGTCVDIVAYDAGAAMAEGKDARVVLIHEQDTAGNDLPFRYHALLWVGGVVTDPAADLQRASVGGCGCLGRKDDDDGEP